MKIKRHLQPCPTCGAARKIRSVSSSELREARERSGLTLREFARRIHRSASYVSDVELGRRNVTEDMVSAYEALPKRCGEGRPR